VALLERTFFMSITGIAFEEAWQHQVQSTYGGVPIYLISREDLITAKKASGRPQDLLDLERLLGTAIGSASDCIA
jgi:hypothetical protein